MQVAGAEGGLVEDRGEQVDVGRHALDPRRVERVDEGGDGRGAVRAVRDDLGQQRVVERRHRRADARRRCPRGPSPGRSNAVTTPVEGRKPARGVLGDDPQLHRPARRAGRPPARTRAARPAATRSCCSTRSRPVTASVTGCSTCRRALTSRKKNDPSSSSRNSTVPALAYPAVRASRRAASPIAARIAAGHRRRRRLLDQLLVPALDAALALAEVDERSMGVAQDLDLDVAGPRQVPLEQQPVVAERRGRLAPGGVERLVELRWLAHDPHPAAAAARRSPSPAAGTRPRRRARAAPRRWRPRRGSRAGRAPRSPRPAPWPAPCRRGRAWRRPAARPTRARRPCTRRRTPRSR